MEAITILALAINLIILTILGFQTFYTMEVITILALVLNFITLIIVGFQTFYTKKSLEAAKNSIELTKTLNQLEQLPDMHHVIHVTIYLERWNKELKEVIKTLKDNNKEKIIEISKRKSVEAKGLIQKWSFEKMPNWLSIIYASGAQYYYNSSGAYKYLWDEKSSKIDPYEYLSRFEESSYYLDILLKYIDDQVPEVFLNCPASLYTSDFFE
ncbi:hypothetical protein CVV38_00330 [Candidatus Peregrinibacteria bacterium HGW-Peregrinibacteria-1]|jgi:hypothetical protein|nr:MAG: hypothetical protein CVV38_00330 [Candidatus Peregrinibacteria bacterium HGW-Peregrinibacteria-1]